MINLYDFAKSDRNFLDQPDLGAARFRRHV